MSEDSNSDATDDGVPAPTFWSWLREQRHGALHAELGETLAEVVQAVIEQGKNGSVTLSIKVAPTKDGASVFVTDDVKKNVPTADRGGSIMFAAANGELTRNDPRQLSLERFHVVETATKEPVVVDTDTGEIREIN